MSGEGERRGGEEEEEKKEARKEKEDILGDGDMSPVTAGVQLWLGLDTKEGFHWFFHSRKESKGMDFDGNHEK